MQKHSITLKTLSIIFVLAFSISLIFNFILLYQNSQRNRVVRVVDGDSFDLIDRRRIRLLSLDAPEKERCYFNQARDRLQSLILDKKVRLADVVTDDYGRILADVFVGRELINKIMLEEGLARFSYVKSPYYDELKYLAQQAKDQKLGIYSPICRTTSPSPDCLIKGNINHGEKHYFTPDCRNYNQVIIDEAFGEKWLCSEKEAVDQGFLKAVNCR